VKPWSRSTFSHKKTNYTSLLDVLVLVIITTKYTNTFTYYFCIVKLATCECLKTTPVSWEHKTVIYYCMLLEEYRRKKNHFPWEFDINPRVTLMGKTFLSISLCAWSPNKCKIQRIELLPSPMSLTINGCIKQHQLGRGNKNNKSTRDTNIVAPRSWKARSEPKYDAPYKTTSTMHRTTSIIFSPNPW
jgi:hypothetical protein